MTKVPEWLIDVWVWLTEPAAPKCIDANGERFKDHCTHYGGMQRDARATTCHRPPDAETWECCRCHYKKQYD